MSKPVFMIVGGNHYNVISIKKAKELGLDVLVIDVGGKSSGAVLADYLEKASVFDIPEVVRIARKYNVIGVMTRNEKAVKTVCAVIEKLGLPSQGVGFGDTVTDKYLMRKAFQRSDVRNLLFYKIEDEADYNRVKRELVKELPYSSFIVKPTDRGGSHGVTKVDRIEQFEEAVRIATKKGRNGKVIVEEFVEGQEIGAQCLCVDGRMELSFLSQKSISENLKTIGHAYPVYLPEKQVDAIKYQCEQALACLGVQNGPTTIDIRLSEKGRSYIVDIGLRVGGNKLPELISYHSGIDFVKESIRLAIGEKVKIPQAKQNPAALLHLHFQSSAKVTAIHPWEHLLEQYRPTEFRLKLKPGSIIDPETQSYGYVICEGENAVQDCSSFVQKLKRLIEFE